MAALVALGLLDERAAECVASTTLAYSLPSQMSLREIASELYVSLNTVKTHSSAVLRKLAVTDRKSAVQAARDRNLL